MAKILVAGQDAAALDTLCAEIAAEGHDAIQVSDGQDAYSATQTEMPDMVFLEADMPVFNGFETCSMLRADPAIPAQLPIVLVVGATVDTRTLEHVRATASILKRHAAYEVCDLLAAHLRG